MTLLEIIVPHLKSENERLQSDISDYRSGVADIARVQLDGTRVSMRDEMIAILERIIESNQSLIDRYEAGER